MAWISLVLALLFPVIAVHSAIVPGMYIFGASMLDAGTNQYINSTNNGANFPPYGQTFFHRPTGRFSNGLILSDFLQIRVGIDRFLSPYLQPNATYDEGANFASAGSGILDSTNKGQVVPLSVQTNQFVKLAKTKSKTELAKSLVVINAGTNDLLTHFGPVPSNPTLPPERVIPQMTAKFKQFLKDVREAGIRKVVIVGISPLGYQPAFRPWPGVESLNLRVRKFNQELMSIVVSSRTEQQHEEKPELVYFNAYDLFIDMINNGFKKYVLSETKANCYKVENTRNVCNDPSKYLYWDGHPTQQGYFYMSDAIWSGDASLMWPVNMQTLLSD